MQKQSTTDSSGALLSNLMSENQANQNLLDIYSKTPPTPLNLNLNDLNKLIEQQSLLNEYKSRAADREINPEIAGTRTGLDREIASTFDQAMKGNLPISLQNALVKAGLQGSLSTGSGISGSSLGQGAATRVFGTGANDYLDRIKGQTAQYLASKDRPIVGLDPSSAANLRVGEQEGNVNLENAFKQQLLGATSAAENNRSNMGQNSLMSAIQEQQQNNSANNYARNQALGLGTGLLGAGIGAAGASAPVWLPLLIAA